MQSSLFASKDLQVERDGDKYAGAYSYDEGKDLPKGCPGRAGIIKELMKIIRNRDGKTHGGLASRQHAAAMKIEILKKVMAWSEREAPPTSTRDEQCDAKGLATFLNHYMMRAFFSSGFTLWTRSVITFIIVPDKIDLSLPFVWQEF